MHWKFKEAYTLGKLTKTYYNRDSHCSSNRLLFRTEQRKKESRQILQKYPDRIPVVVQRAPKSSLVDLDKHKFLVPYEVTIAQFMWILRQRLTLSPNKAIYLFVNRTLPQSRYVTLIHQLFTCRAVSYTCFSYHSPSLQNFFPCRQCNIYNDEISMCIVLRTRVSYLNIISIIHILFFCRQLIDW
jgi:hypothetical protein